MLFHSTSLPLIPFSDSNNQHCGEIPKTFTFIFILLLLFLPISGFRCLFRYKRAATEDDIFYFVFFQNQPEGDESDERSRFLNETRCLGWEAATKTKIYTEQRLRKTLSELHQLTVSFVMWRDFCKRLRFFDRFFRAPCKKKLIVIVEKKKKATTSLCDGEVSRNSRETGFVWGLGISSLWQKHFWETQF